MKMTKEELKEMLKQLGARAESVSEKIMGKVDAEKAELDKETRREVRKFWTVACVFSFLIGFGFSHIL